MKLKAWQTQALKFAFSMVRVDANTQVNVNKSLYYCLYLSIEIF